MEASSSSRRTSHSFSRERFVATVISPAIRGQTCPICLKILDDRRSAVIAVCLHAYCLECIRKWSNLKRRCPICNAEFGSWFCKIDFRSRKFQEEKLPALDEGEKVDIQGGSSLRYRRREIQRAREELQSISWRRRSLPWRRSFGRPGSAPPDVIAERKLQWRASIYNRVLQAVPLSSGNYQEQNISGNGGLKERVLQKIEPWIRRELQAILGDPDPSVIVHVATSLFFASLEKKANVSSRQLDVEDNITAPLRPFLHNRTNMFWHELRCFAESSFNIETYDAVVKYNKVQ